MGMQQTHPMAPPPERSPDPPVEVVRAAFRELHGRRLHGFALLLTLGDRERAASLASDALAAGQLRVDELRHPERAAAWLRRQRPPAGGSVQAGAARRAGGPPGGGGGRPPNPPRPPPPGPPGGG